MPKPNKRLRPVDLRVGDGELKVATLRNSDVNHSMCLRLSSIAARQDQRVAVHTQAAPVSAKGSASFVGYRQSRSRRRRAPHQGCPRALQAKGRLKPYSATAECLVVAPCLYCSSRSRRSAALRRHPLPGSAAKVLPRESSECWRVSAAETLRALRQARSDPLDVLIYRRRGVSARTGLRRGTEQLASQALSRRPARPALNRRSEGPGSHDSSSLRSPTLA